MSALRDLGCDLAQGYLFSRPLGADQFDVKLRALIAAGP
jgi:EAL domain-containing protein (putative c-di-GMP-specific phosphodiesterase class I)